MQNPGLFIFHKLAKISLIIQRYFLVGEIKKVVKKSGNRQHDLVFSTTLKGMNRLIGLSDLSAPGRLPELYHD